MKAYITTTTFFLIACVLLSCSGASSEQTPTSTPPLTDDSIEVTPAVASMPSSGDEFFVGVLDRLDIQGSEFALSALDAWASMENTRAEWNPLATTMKAPGSSNFNSVGVQNYPDSETGMEATADTLDLSYYNAIRAMLRQESFDRDDVEQALITWSGNGGYVPHLLEEWTTLYGNSVGGDALPPSASQVQDLLCGEEVPGMDSRVLVLSRQDVPEGFRLSKQESRDNRAVARTWDDPDKWLMDYEAWGRIAGHKVEFTKGTQDVIESEAAVYRTCEGARDAFRAEIDTFEEQQRSLFEAQGFRVMAFEEIDELAIADESRTWHAKVSGNLLGTPVALDWISIVFRKGNVTGYAAWTAVNVNVLKSDVIEVAKKLVIRIDDIQRLASLPTPTLNSSAKSPWFYQVSEDDIETIAVTYQDDFVSFHRVAPHTWAFDEPASIPPDHTRWGGITLLLSGPKTRRDLTEFRPVIDNPAQYGLDDPDTIVDVGLTNGRSLQFRLGDPTSDRDHHYAQVIGFPQLFLIANTWGDMISRLAKEPPLPKWYVHRDVSTIEELNIFQGNPTKEETPVLQFIQEDGDWKVANIGIDKKAVPVDPVRWEKIGPLMAGPEEIAVAVPVVDDQDYSPWGIVDDSHAIEIRFSGKTDSGTKFIDGNLFRLGNKSEDGAFYYAKSELGFVPQPVLKMDAEWIETMLGLVDDVPYGELPDEEAASSG